MRALTSLDAFFLAAEDGRTNANLAALAILEAPTARRPRLRRENLISLVSERLHLLPPLRWRLAEVPLGLGHPYWVQTEVDLEFHIREIALPEPGGIDQLHEQVARIANHPMDRSRPLWEIYLISGLHDGRDALLTKFHHAAIDGVSGAEIMSVLFDGSPRGRQLQPRPAFKAEPEPGQLKLAARGLADTLGHPDRIGAAGWRTINYLDQVATLRSIPGTRAAGQAVRRLAGAAHAAPGDPEALLNSPALVAPRTAFNATLSRRRRFTTVTLPLGPVKALKQTHGATVNDVIVSLCAGALRAWLGSTAQLPAEPLVAAIPVSVRTDRERGTFGNAVGTMVVPLPTDEEDPLIRLARCRDGLSDAKHRHQATPASLMRDSTDMVPPVLFGAVTRTLTRLSAARGLNPVANLVISNVPGSASPLYCAGVRVAEHYPVSTIADSLGLNITVFSYLDKLHFGLVADRVLVPDLEGLADALTHELDVLLDAGRETEGAHR